MRREQESSGRHWPPSSSLSKFYTEYHRSAQTLSLALRRACDRQWRACQRTLACFSDGRRLYRRAQEFSNRLWRRCQYHAMFLRAQWTRGREH
ncbi:hypothetical protein CDCA_CDCA09G2600 [Cyanidium caldarium]|uniref:Uncharacterized protein n=1 Tax=Cyanidium caldarium TaxID=2771 RepID=A0AAV9IWT8_CYACA|nr:hypothetical protein CDCA_CDCA09G2600 [Cyanidium caldarium]